MKLKRRILTMPFLFLALPFSGVANAATYEQVFRLAAYLAKCIALRLSIAMRRGISAAPMKLLRSCH